MPITHYESIHKEKVEYRLYKRYRTEINQLRAIGFDQLQYTREVIFPFSAVLMFWMYPVLRWYGREVFHIESPLRYVLMHPMMLSFEYASYAQIFGLGVRFATRFVDGTVLITCNFGSGKIENSEKGFYKYRAFNEHMGRKTTIPIGEAWGRHIEHVLNIERKGRETDDNLSLEKYEAIVKIEDSVEIMGLRG